MVHGQWSLCVSTYWELCILCTIWRLCTDLYDISCWWGLWGWTAANMHIRIHPLLLAVVFSICYCSHVGVYVKMWHGGSIHYLELSVLYFKQNCCNLVSDLWISETPQIHATETYCSNFSFSSNFCATFKFTFFVLISPSLDAILNWKDWNIIKLQFRNHKDTLNTSWKTVVDRPKQEYSLLSKTNVIWNVHGMMFKIFFCLVHKINHIMVH